MAKFIFDDEYSYSAEVYIEISDRGLYDIYSIDPFESTRMIIVTSVPDELVDRYKTVTVQWGFADAFGSNDDDTYTRITKWEDADNLYQFILSK